MNVHTGGTGFCIFQLLKNSMPLGYSELCISTLDVFKRVANRKETLGALLLDTYKAGFLASTWHRLIGYFREKSTLLHQLSSV